MKYGKLKTGKTLKSRGYSLQKGIWVEIEDKDIEYFTLTGRVEFAPSGIIPKNEIEKVNTDGIISIEGKGKDGIIITKKSAPEEIDEELKAEEDNEILRIREKYRRKKEQKEKEETEQKKKEAEEKKKKKEADKKLKEKGDKIQDTTNPTYIKEKNKTKELL